MRYHLRSLNMAKIRYTRTTSIGEDVEKKEHLYSVDGNETLAVVYTMEYLLFSHKKEWNLAICNDMDGAREYNAKWNKSEKDKYHMISLICGI